ncbi:hypothetical protein [Streptomyces pratensis]|uniref:hypothetical protein n=1 Tax=Streptomyces pratensis TaxID=1169025 RepID=UPI00301662D2
MRLHRILTAAALTAAVAPMALFAAPAAYATGEPPADSAPSASASPTAAPEPSAASDAAASDAAATSDASDDASDAAGAGDEAQHLPEKAEATSSAVGGSPAAQPAKPSAEPSPTYTRPAFCSGIPDEERGKTSLHGLPSKIVAGSGWHDFTYRVTNVSEVKVMETDISLYLGTADPKLDDIAQLAVTVEWFNSTTDAWKPIEGEGADAFGNNEFATVKSLKPGEYADAAMRIKVGDQAQPGAGYFFTIGHSYGEDGQCGFDEISQFDFTVLAPESDPGKVEDSEGTPGKVDEKEDAENEGAAGRGGDAGTGNTPAPQGELDVIPVSGRLAATGSSSALPTAAALSGAAVVLGAGAVFVVRRRQGGSLSS